MKVLLVNTWYKKGSTGQLVESLHSFLLKRGEQSFVAYGRGKKTKEANVFKFCRTFESKVCSVLSRFTGNQYGLNFFSTRKLIRIIKKIKPDVINVHFIGSFVLNNYRFLKYLKKINIPTLVTLHEEHLFTGNCTHSCECRLWESGQCKNCPRFRQANRTIFFNRTNRNWKMMKKALEPRNALRYVCVSEWLYSRASRSEILRNIDGCVVNNGINTDIFHYTDSDNYKGEIKREKTIFFSSPYFSPDNEMKGCNYFLDICRQTEKENFVFLVSGANKKNFDFSKIPNIKYLGNLAPNEMAEYYRYADLTLLLSKRETFSMVTAESLCCGTPVIGFRCGAAEQIDRCNYNHFVNYGDIAAVIKLISDFDRTKVDKREISRQSIAYLDIKNMQNMYYKEFKKLNEIMRK